MFPDASNPFIVTSDWVPAFDIWLGSSTSNWTAREAIPVSALSELSICENLTYSFGLFWLIMTI
jgi:hypothetical protein